MAKIFIAVLVVTIGLIVIFQFIDPNLTTTAINSGSTALVNDADSISVSITGEVVRTGTYIVDINSTLGDLIEVANGVNTNADELAYDTSYLLEDGLSFYIAPKYDNTDVCSLEPIKKVNINSDSQTTLQQVSGIGEAIAKAIVAYREEGNSFRRIEQLKEVSGIGSATFEKIKNYVVLRSA